jgi:Uma2 family endonuclease
MSTARRLHHTYEDYLHLLAQTDAKLEFCGGEIFAMAGGTPTHAELAAAMIEVLRSALKQRCRVYSSDLKVHIEASGLSTFPDASVVCGELQTAGIDRNAVVNPALVVEVTSRSTEDYDRGEKLRHYAQIPALVAVLVVSHRRPRITVFERADDGMTAREVGEGEQVLIDALGLGLALDEVYAGIQLESE